MDARDIDTAFAGSIPALYERYLVPLIFAPYADELVRRLAAHKVTRVLEIAAGTGVVTRAMAKVLPSQVSIVATDLNQAMLDQAAVVPIARAVTWRQADAMQLPFADGSFDAVVCQFGVMFMPDKAKAFAEAHRVLDAGAVCLFNVWDRIEANPFAHVVTLALETVFPANPIRFMARTPHGYHDPARIAADLQRGGFVRSPQIDVVTAQSRGESAQAVALAFCQGTPLRNEIEARDASKLSEATDAVARALEVRYGVGPIEDRIQALVVTVEK